MQVCTPVAAWRYTQRHPRCARLQTQSARAPSERRCTSVSAALDVIVETVANGDKVSLVGFGTFHSKRKEAREGRNPGTQEPIHIPATTTPTFSFGKPFKDAVKNGGAAHKAH